MSALHPVFASVFQMHGMPQRDTYRGWDISFDYPPIPVRDFDYSASHPDYDGEGDNRLVHGCTRADVIVAIDDWHAENEA